MFRRYYFFWILGVYFFGVGLLYGQQDGSFASPFLDTTHLKLNLDVQFERKYIDGTAELTFAPVSPDLQSFRLDAVSLLMIQVEISKDQGTHFQAISYGVFRDWLEIYAPQDGFGSNPLIVRIRYRAYASGDISGGPGFGPGLTFVDHAQLGRFVFTAVEPRRARSWYPCVDRPGDLLLYQGTFTVPEGLEVISNGTLISRSYPTPNRVTFYWKHPYEIATYLISMTAGPFVLILDRSYQNLPIEYWVPKPLVEKAQKDLGRTPEMMKLFSEYFCPYPFEKYATVVVPNYGGAMEHTTATTYSDNLITGDLTHERVAAHELGHHWFGDMVTCATWNDLWLNEGFATFMELLWAEHIDGKASYEKKLDHYRSEYFKHWEQMKTAIVDPQTAPEDKFHATTYKKGGFVLHLLRQIMGEPLFQAGMRDYLKTYYLKNATTAQFQKVMEKAYGNSLENFFQTWVYSPGHPVLEIECEKIVDGTLLRLRQKKNPEWKSGTIALEFLSEKNLDSFQKKEFSFSGDCTEYRLPAEWGNIAGVLSDNDYTILAEIQTQQDTSAWKAVYHASSTRPKTRKLALAGIAQQNPEAIPEMALSLWNTGDLDQIKMAFDAYSMVYGQKKGLPLDSKIFGRLLPYLSSQDKDIRRLAVKSALAFFQEMGSLQNLNIEAKTVLQELHTRLSSDSEMQIAWDSAIVLAKLKDPELFPLLKAEMDRPGDWTRSWLKEGILEAIGYLNDLQGLSYLQQYIVHENEWMRRYSVLAIGHLQQSDILWDYLLLKILNSPKEVLSVQKAVLEAYSNRLKYLASIPDFQPVYQQAKARLDESLKTPATHAEIKEGIQKLLKEN
ncbi:MAG: M1 family aminopeptidase [Planctomycetota bacterium]